MKVKKKNLFGRYWIYLFVAAAWILCTILIDRDMLSPVIKNQLIPICCWATMAVSLNLVVRTRSMSFRTCWLPSW